jgi:hypothetical protein
VSGFLDLKSVGNFAVCFTQNQQNLRHRQLITPVNSDPRFLLLAAFYSSKSSPSAFPGVRPGSPVCGDGDCSAIPVGFCVGFFDSSLVGRQDWCS